MNGFVKIAAVVPGIKLQADGRFTCLDGGEIVTVIRDGERKGMAGLYVKCRKGRHYLDGQIKGDHLIGLTEVVSPAGTPQP